jgi:hypothetical protein
MGHSLPVGQAEAVTAGSRGYRRYVAEDTG